MTLSAPVEMKKSKKTYYVAAVSISTTRVMMNQASIDTVKPIIAPYIHFFALSTPELSPVIPLLICI